MKKGLVSAVALMVSGLLVMAAGSSPAPATASTAVPSAAGASAPVTPKPGEGIDDDNPPYIAMAIKVGTLGPALEATLGIIDGLNLRAGCSYFRLRHGGAVSDVDYDFDVKLAAVPLLVDWHPFRNEFRITGGVIYNRNMADLDSTPDKITKIGDMDYTPEEIGELSGSVRFKNWAPYIGLGYGNAVLDADKRWGFVFDIGVMWQGSPSVALSANGTLANDPVFQQNLAKQEQDIQDDADAFRLYPVISFGISYQF